MENNTLYLQIKHLYELKYAVEYTIWYLFFRDIYCKRHDIVILQLYNVIVFKVNK
jgi:hypothetical protein